MTAAHLDCAARMPKALVLADRKSRFELRRPAGMPQG
jgi:hypothetical protein